MAIHSGSFRASSGSTLPSVYDETRQRFADVDEAIAATRDRLRLIARQNAALAAAVEVLGHFPAAGIDTIAQHLRDAHGGNA